MCNRVLRIENAGPNTRLSYSYSRVTRFAHDAEAICCFVNFGNNDVLMRVFERLLGCSKINATRYTDDNGNAMFKRIISKLLKKEAV